MAITFLKKAAAAVSAPAAGKVSLFVSSVDGLPYVKDESAAVTALSGERGGLKYQYDTDTAASDPGAGFLRFNHATLASATALYISETDSDSNGLAAYLASLDDSTSTVKGQLTMTKTTNAGVLAIFNITGTITDNGSWDTFTVANVVSSGSFSDNDSVKIEFRAKGDKGDTGASGGGAVPNGFSVRTSGDITLNSTSWANVDTGLDLSLAAVAGDVVEVGISARVGSEATTLFLDAATVVAGSPVNAVGQQAAAPTSTTGDGVSGWIGSTGVATTMGGTVLYTLQSGDISGGTVTLRLRYRTGSATNKVISATTARPFHFHAKNLAQ